MNEPKVVSIYTRGIATPKGAAYGALLVYGSRRKELSGGEIGASNNRMDLLAAVESLKALKQLCRVTLYNTNGYLIDGMAKGWAARWREAGWVTGEGKPTAHAELWDSLLELCAIHEVEFVRLSAEGIEEYDLCNHLAQKVIQEQLCQSAAVPGEEAKTVEQLRE